MNVFEAMFEPKFNWNNQGWYAEFLLKIDLKFLLIKTAGKLNLKTDLESLHIIPGH